MNLASVARFDKAGCRVVFERGTGVVYDADGNTLLEATLTDDLYILAPELISKDLVQLMNTRGTKVRWSPPYTPELNAIVERGYQTIFNMGHSMLLGAVVPMKYWTYAMQYAVYI